MGVRVNGKKGVALVDSGWTQTLVRGGWVRPSHSSSKVWIRCIHGDVRDYPVGRAKLEVAGQQHWIDVGIAPNLPYEVIIGRDWPHFKASVSLELDSSLCTQREEMREELGEKQKADPTLREAWRRAEAGKGDA